MCTEPGRGCAQVANEGAAGLIAGRFVGGAQNGRGMDGCENRRVMRCRRIEDAASAFRNAKG
jgi:hypothetical protein